MSTREETQNISVLQSVREQALLSPSFLKRLKVYFLFTLATMGLDMFFVLFMTTLLVVVVVALNGNVRFFQASLGLPLAIMAGAILIKSIRSPKQAKVNSLIVLREWLPFLFIAFIYENLRDYAGHVEHFDVAKYMYHWDGLIFGTQPTVWAQKIFSPLLTDIMSFSYALYFALPLALMFFLSLANQRNYFRSMVLALSFTFVIGFVCYTFFPCSPPRFYIEHLYTDPHRLTGIFLFNKLQGMWDNLSVVSGGAFPSLHVGISSVALIYAYKYRNISKLNTVLWYLYIPLVTSLWFSTVYLRHHWVVDIFAGWAVALSSYLLAERLLKVWLKLRKRFAL
ncbi:MAG: phosphatase PAP2 family protein [Pseudomonadota bacterium]